MKRSLLLPVMLCGFYALSQHNYTITSNADATYIRDAKVVNDETIICALDFRNERKNDIDIFETGLAEMDASGNANWAKKIHVPNSEMTLGLSTIKHKNGNYYLLGLTVVEYKQYGFVLRVNSKGDLIKSFIIKLDDDMSYAINKMKLNNEGNLVTSMYEGGHVYFIELNPELEVNWEAGFATSTEGTGKQPGFDFQFVDDGLISVGKSGRHFTIMKITKEGKVDFNFDYQTGEYSLAKTIQVLPDGNFVVTGDYLTNKRYKSFIAKFDGNDGTPLWKKEIDQFDGTFHYQQTELVDNEIHFSLMGNNDPSMMDPEFQNYYLRLDFNGDVLHSYRNGEKYDLADYQSLMRSKNHSIIYGSAYDDKLKVAGLVHSYQSHEFDPCYWTALELTTSPSATELIKNFGIPSRASLEVTKEITISLNDLRLKTEGTCKQVWEESTELEEENAIEPETPAETVETIVENDEFARENHENLLTPDHEFTVFPNPNRGLFSIKTDYLMVDVFILDQAGKIIYQGVAENGDSIDLSGHPTGVYIMKVVTESDNFIRRIVIQ